jgi:lipoprotein-anchoring transpeptidase ErfK/SrfK
VAVAALSAVAIAVPVGAASAAPPPPPGLGQVLGTLLDGLRGVRPPAGPAASPPAPGVPASAAVQQAPPTPPPAPPAAGPGTPLAVEQHLAALRYDVGAVDGDIDDTAASAIMAFQKVHGLDRTGELSDQVAAAIMGASGVPTPLVANADANKVEIDLTRQVLFLYEGGQLSKILPISSGKASTPTPTGSYHIYHRAYGWETSPLGQLYNSQYFVGGYAIHGSYSVPNYPASHGCVRIPMSAADWFPDHVGIGTPVYLLGG